MDKRIYGRYPYYTANCNKCGGQCIDGPSGRALCERCGATYDPSSAVITEARVNMDHWPYVQCPKCGKMVRMNKPIVGSLHVCS